MRPGASSTSACFDFEGRLVLGGGLEGVVKYEYRVKGVEGFVWLSELMMASQMMAWEGGSEAFFLEG